MRTCGCCGGWMDGEQEQNEDEATCPECESWIEERFLKPMETDGIAKLSAALNATNRAKFDAMDRDQQLALYHAAIEDGLFTWTVTR